MHGSEHAKTRRAPSLQQALNPGWLRANQISQMMNACIAISIDQCLMGDDVDPERKGMLRQAL